jgi:hypothetical protein
MSRNDSFVVVVDGTFPLSKLQHVPAWDALAVARAPQLEDNILLEEKAEDEDIKSLEELLGLELASDCDDSEDEGIK